MPGPPKCALATTGTGRIGWKKTGLIVRRELDEKTYAKGVKVSDAETAALNIKGDALHPQWNYTISPRPRQASG